MNRTSVGLVEFPVCEMVSIEDDSEVRSLTKCEELFKTNLGSAGPVQRNLLDLLSN